MTTDTTFDRLIGAVIGNYKIERLLAGDEFGPIFGARDTDGGSYRLRLLPVRPPASGPAADSYLARFQQQAEHLALLRHPQILPLVDFGIYRGSPFLVWPHQPLRSLSGLLAESGPLDPTAAGRYLSQIADALEYAHRHETLHRNLSTDCVFLHLNGQLVVADFGVRRIFELTASEAQVSAILGASDATAPEQVVGGRVHLYTDVYALGALVFRLLTGAPMFSGRVREDVAQQHVYSQTPSLRARRPGLPAGLEAVLTRAIAKNPEQRYQHATAFARAYSEVLANSAPEMLAPVGLVQIVEENDVRSPLGSATRRAPGTFPLRMSNPASEPRPMSRTMLSRVLATVVILVVLAGGGVFILHGAGSTVGGGRPAATVTFSDVDSGQSGVTDGATDSAKVVAQNLGVPASGSNYYAWLINTSTEEITPLGALIHSGDTYSVTFVPSANGTTGAKNLLGAGDKVEITLEQGDVEVPVGRVVLSGAFPPKTFVHIQHLLLNYPTTEDKNAPGLLVSSLLEIQRINTTARTLQSAVGHSSLTVRCAAQSILDILEGDGASEYQPLSSACAGVNITNSGDQYGYALAGAKAIGYTTTNSNPGYLDSASSHAALAGSQPDADSFIKLRVRDAVTAMTNANTALAALRSDAVALLNDPSNSVKAADLVTQASIAYNGSGNQPTATANGLPDPFSGGILVAYHEAQLMATLTLS